MKKKVLVTLLTVGVVAIAIVAALVIPKMKKNDDEPTTVVEDVDDNGSEEKSGKKFVLVEDENKDTEQNTQGSQAYEDFLEEEDADKLETEEFTVTPYQTTFYVTSKTPVYEKPNNTSKELGSVDYGTEILTNGKVNEVDWYRFILDNKDVFISASYLSAEKLKLEEEVVDSDYPSQEEILKAIQEKIGNDGKFVNEYDDVPTSQTGSGSGEDLYDGFVPSGRDIIVY